jgi:hypothetical protein
VRNVTFLNIATRFPLKGIYVKPNPGNSGTGTIRDITYRNYHGHEPIWWAIWVSTQQQSQPGGGSTGCSFLFPLPGQSCPTQPRVPVQNLVLHNVTFVDAWLSPGVLRCNNTYAGPGSGPCTGWRWTDVTATSVLKWPMGSDFLCHAIEKPQWVNVGPACRANITTSAALLNHAPLGIAHDAAALMTHAAEIGRRLRRHGRSVMKAMLHLRRLGLLAS